MFLVMVLQHKTRPTRKKQFSKHISGCVLVDQGANIALEHHSAPDSEDPGEEVYHHDTNPLPSGSGGGGHGHDDDEEVRSYYISYTCQKI